MANRLADAISPYLRSHADNPVDWWPWGADAFAEASRRDVPVLVSIGYSTCHWCHVMARESFSDPRIADYLNANFVAIKVDREEHPDVDASYMAAASAFTNNLGWPLNVFSTPNGLPFFAGTYFPPRPVNGMPDFLTALTAVTNAWTARRREVDETATALAGALAASVRSMAEQAEELGETAGERLPSEAELQGAVQTLSGQEDPVFGGFGAAPDFAEPKFAVAPALGFLAEQPGEGAALAARTLKRMGASPLRDPTEGGFFRYSTRRDWGDPHYERMLYDNALLLDVAMRVWGNDPEGNAWAATLSDALAGFLTTVLRIETGAFASGQDSESVVDGRISEGGYYALDAENRALQPAPALDGKVLAGWNGLAIAALARAGAALQRPEWIAAARQAAEHVLTVHVRAEPVGSAAVDSDADGGAGVADVGTAPLRLARASLGMRVSDAVATLEDYGMLAGGLLALAVATGEVEHAVTARALVDATLDAAGASASGMPFAVPGGADPVLSSQGIALEVDASEGAYPSGLSATAHAAYQLWLLSGDPRYREAAEKAVALVGANAVERPLAYGSMLALSALLQGPGAQLVSVVTADVGVDARADGDVDARADSAAAPGSRARSREEVQGLVQQYAASVDLNIVVTEEQAAAFAEAGFELFAGRTTQGGMATSYLCENMVCSLPVQPGPALAADFDRLNQRG